MNRLSREDSPEGRLDRVWQKLTPFGRSDFEKKYGSWGTLSDNQRYSFLSDYFTNLREQEEAERIRATQEPIVRALERLAQSSDRTSRDLSGRLDKIEDRTRDYLRDKELERGLSEQRIPPLPQPSPQSPTVLVTTPIRANCQYDRDKGPKECIIVQQRADGMYGQCQVGYMANHRQNAPFRWMSSSRQITGCPSNSLINVCPYLLNDWVKM